MDCVGPHPPPVSITGVTFDQIDAFIPKFVALNRLWSGVTREDYEFIIVCDDDIVLPSGFVDAYLDLVGKHNLALSQPARTHDSYIDHPFVECLDGIEARCTRFVEIGPLFAIRRDLGVHLLPFEESSPMGWGYDLVWPCVVETLNLRMGIVDAVPVAHSLRKPVQHYAHREVDRQMRHYLDQRQHLTLEQAFFIVESYG